jgi:chemotaxis protein histidine kinase CheA/ActR/RegA family two-component response regulator
MAANAMTPFLAEMRKELQLVLPDFERWLHTIGHAQADDPSFMDAFEAYGGQVERTGTTAEMLGMPGLNAWCTHLNSNLMSVAMLEGDARANAAAYFLKWPALIDRYLDTPADFDASLALAEFLTVADAPQPLDETAGVELIGQLTVPPVVPEELMAAVAEAEKPIEVTPADVSLVLSEDADRDVYHAFIDEAPANLATFAELTAHIAAGNASTDDLRTAKRIAHSFKGSASIVGLRGIASLGHYTEDILEYFEQNPVKPPRALGLTLVDASDCLSQMVGHLQGDESEPENAFAVLSSVVTWANMVKSGEIATVADDHVVASQLVTAEPAASTPLSASFDDTIVAKAAPAAQAAAKPAATAADAGAALRVSVKTVDELFRLVGELTTKIGQLETRIANARARSRTLLKQNLAVQQRVMELDNLVVLRGLSLQKTTSDDGEAKFDPLEMDRYNELHGATRALVETTADAREIANALEEDVATIATDLAQQNQINKDLRHQVISTRMTPVESLAARLTRNVRQTCQQTGKDAELIITGGDILVDGDVLNKLADPLLHILRNAVDHGIESPGLREAHGKPARGRINLDFSRQGSSVRVRIADDGKGLDYGRIRDKALMNGLITHNQQLTQAELARLTLLPGFSTRDQVTEISGRGVGMDVVASRLNELKGTVELHSEPDHGCEVTLRFQASLITQQTLLVEAAEQTFAVPIHNIEQAVPPGSGETLQDGNHWVLHLQDRSFPIRDLATLTGFPTATLTSEHVASRPKVIIHSESGNVAVMVDRVIDTRDLIVKSLGRFLPHVHGISGTTLLGDGAVVPLLNVPELLAEPVVVSQAAVQMAEAARKQARRVLVVDDSLSVRKSLTQLLEDAAFEVVGAGDGLDAIRTLESFNPHVICTDLEMPNMNGLELTEHLRRREDTREMPIIMITSRSMDKHREQARRAGVDYYVTKPYTDQELLSQVRQAVQRSTESAQTATA